jgi:superfamily II DNA/RNA helicase
MTLQDGDRVLARDRPWRIRSRKALPDHNAVFELEALDGDDPVSLSLVVPPDEVLALASEAVAFDPSGLDSFQSWSRAHRVLRATLVHETGLLSGARFGRVALEAYQLAPTLRLLAKPRASLLIADDVGLGKTIEAGLALLELMARGRARRVLIVTPPGLLYQWSEELAERFGLAFETIDNAAGLARVQGDLPAGANPWDVLPRVLTSVDFLKKETVWRRALRKPWDLIIVDEAHALAESGTPQNPYRTQRTRLGVALRDAARGLLLLTATPHNGYPHSFRSLIELVEPTNATFEGRDTDLARRVQSAMIRRMKPQIRRKLPAGSEEPVFPRRRVVGIPVHTAAADKDLLRKVASYCSRTARSAEGAEDADLVTFAMQIVKKRALSTRIALANTIENRLAALRKPEEAEAAPTRPELRDLQADLPLDEATAERTAIRLVRSAIPKEEKRRKAEVRALNGIRRVLRSLEGPDPKVEALVAEIRSVLDADAEEKVIVFTEYRDSQDALRSAIEAIPELSEQTVMLRGGLSGKQRRKILARFEEPGTRILLSTDAASEGLNLQKACHRLVHLELPWNPNRLEQRNGRIDRYGQTRIPEIRYLYYPDSHEDDVLHQLVDKIERISGDRVSTPDILGVIQGSGELDKGLVELDPEAKDVESAKRNLVRMFEDRTEDFVRNVQPLVAAGSDAATEIERIVELLNTTEQLLSDDEGFGALLTDVLGTSAVSPTETEGVVRIDVPIRFRGPGVVPTYAQATFSRDVAIEQGPEVEFVTPVHPLARAVAADARRRLLQVYPDERGLPPRRLAARRIGKGETASVVFTFLGAVHGGGGLLAEHVVAVRLTPEGQEVADAEAALAYADAGTDPGEVPADTLTQLFNGRFDGLSETAARIANERLRERAEVVRGRRRKQAAILRNDLETDLADRMMEIDEAERRAKGLIETASGQGRLFAEQESSARSGFQTRRAAAEAQAGARRREIDDFERVDESSRPRPLGALFLVPEGAE